jgi:hypothetical protein
MSAETAAGVKAIVITHAHTQRMGKEARLLDVAHVSWLNLVQRCPTRDNEATNVNQQYTMLWIS